MRQSTNESPGAVGKTAAGADIKAGELPQNDSTSDETVKAFPAQAAWRERNPKKTWAHAALRSGVRRGLVTPQPCEVCGDETSEGHHDDYDKPLEVRWLCRRHHKRLHARRAGA